MHSILERIHTRYAPLVLLAIVGVATFVYAPPLPKDHRVELRLPDAAVVTAVELAWAPVAKADEPVLGATWHFAAGRAPGALATDVRLPDGRYALDVRVERGAEGETFHRVITLGNADRITVPLR
jgi:hypothetical protein